MTDDRRCITRCSPNQRVQTRHQFFHVKRFGQIVVGTGFKTGHFVLPVATGGQNQHRKASLFFAQHADQRHPVHLRQTDVDHCCVVRIFTAVVQTLFTVARRIVHKSGTSQMTDELLAQCFFIFNNQDSHRFLPCGSGRFPVGFFIGNNHCCHPATIKQHTNAISILAVWRGRQHPSTGLSPGNGGSLFDAQAGGVLHEIVWRCGGTRLCGHLHSKEREYQHKQEDPPFTRGHHHGTCPQVTCVHCTPKPAAKNCSGF